MCVHLIRPFLNLRMMANKWHIFTISNGKYQVNMLLSNEFKESQRGVSIENMLKYRKLVSLIAGYAHI